MELRVIPRTPAGRTASAGLGRPAALVALVLGSGALALLCQWPALRSIPAQATLNTLVTMSYAATAGVGARSPGRRGTGPSLLLGAGLAWSATWAGFWEVGPIPALAFEVQPVFWILLLGAVLEYPTGRITERTERIFMAAVLVILPALLTANILTSRASWKAYHSDVWWPGVFPDRNAANVITVLTAAAALGLTGAFIVLLRQRLRRLPMVDRRVQGPTGLALAAAGICAFLTTVLGSHHAARCANPFYLAMAVALLGMPISIGIGELRRQLVRAAAAETLARLASPPTVESVQLALIEALGDETMTVLYRVPNPDSPDGPPADGTAVYVDGAGTPRHPPTAADRLLVPVTSGTGDEVALLVTDGALRRHEDLVGAALATAGFALENARLQAVLQYRLAAVRDSRTRIVETALAERRRLEQDLHDGAQQRLLAVAARIGIARIHAGEQTTAIDEASAELTAALGELRTLARGIYPAVLGEAGLAVALDAAMEDFPIPVAVEVAGDRFDAATETAAYLTVIDILTHAADRAGATRGTVRSWHQDNGLWLQIEHNGRAAGDGLLSAVDDRLRALDGALEPAPPRGAAPRAAPVGMDDPVVVTARIPCV